MIEANRKRDQEVASIMKSQIPHHEKEEKFQDLQQRSHWVNYMQLETRYNPYYVKPTYKPYNGKKFKRLTNKLP